MARLANSRESANDPDILGKLEGLVFGRLMLIFLLLLASWWWTGSVLQAPGGAFPIHLFLAFVVSIGLTIVYYFLSRWNTNFAWQIRGQFQMDAILITWLVWATGDIMSPYITLYVILISVAGFYLGKNDTLFVAGSCATLFTLLSVLTTQSWIFSFSDDVPTSRSVQVVGLNTVAILLVGLLAARISERRRISEELKHSEASFADLHILHERIVESINSGLVTADLDGRIYTFNRAATEISGLSARNTIGKSVYTVFGDEIREAIDQCLAAAHRNEFASPPFETVFSPGGNGNARSVTAACSVSPLLGRSGGVTGLIVTFRDISEIRALEETVRRSDRLAAVGRMAAGLAHEIRNPLGSMGSALQFLQERLAPESEEASLMKVVLRESDRLNNIITGFLAYARPSTNGLMKQRQSTLDIGVAIGDCVTLLRHGPEVKETHELDFEPPLEPVRIEADETQIKQVIWNLSQNALQAMPNGGKLKIAIDDDSKGPVRVRVEDTGEGMSEETLEHIFEPFSRGSRGTGLGLSIVHNIVRDHGGTIDIKSRRGVGTVVTLDLPRGKSDRKN